MKKCVCKIWFFLWITSIISSSRGVHSFYEVVLKIEMIDGKHIRPYYCRPCEPQCRSLLNKHVVSELVQGMRATTLLFPLKPAAFGTAIILPSKLAASVTIIILGTTTIRGRENRYTIFAIFSFLLFFQTILRFSFFLQSSSFPVFVLMCSIISLFTDLKINTAGNSKQKFKSLPSFSFLGQNLLRKMFYSWWFYTILFLPAIEFEKILPKYRIITNT